MEQPQAECVAYLQQPITRGDLLPLIESMSSLQTTLVNIVMKVLAQYQEEAERSGGTPHPGNVAGTIFDALSPMLLTYDKLNAQIREMKNAGVDPEWDHGA